MNDLELCKKFAELEGVIGDGINWGVADNTFIWIGNVTRKYNPITDLALNCAAADKYEVTTIHSHMPDGTYFAVVHIAEHNRISVFNKEDIPKARIECILKSEGKL